MSFGPCRTSLCLIAFIFAAFAPNDIHAEEQAPDDRPTIGLVLSGGGARGAAHVGVIKVLDELRIPVDYIAGTSMGAIVGGLYASGMTADELENVIETADWTALLSDRPPRAQRSFRRKSDDVGFLVDFELGIGRLLYYYRLGDQALPVLDTSIYVGTSIEAGNVWQNSDAIGLDNTLIAGSAFIVFDTLLGPLYIAYGASEGGRHSAYLFLGQTF
jgi:hypothetical protein